MKTALIEIIRHVVCGHEKKILTNINCLKLLMLAKSHSLDHLLYLGYLEGMFEASEEEVRLLKQAYERQVYKAIVQDAESEAIKDAFTKQQIDHLFLKGSVLKHCYPDMILRSMADLDILVPKKMLKRIRQIMKGLGYTCKHTGGNHDVYHKEPFMNVEIHRAMMDESYSMSKYYRSIWSQLKQPEGYSFEMASDDFYIYLVAHAIKHFQNGGTGLRSVLDMYVYRHYNQLLNQEYMDQEFKRLGIFKLAGLLEELSAYWFGSGDANEDLLAIEDYILRSGTYGATEHSMITSGKLDANNLFANKSRYLLRKAFPRLSVMKSIYPSLRYFIFLFPFYYGFRIMSLVFRRGHLAKSHLKTLNTISSNQVKRVSKVMNLTKEDETK